MHSIVCVLMRDADAATGLIYSGRRLTFLFRICAELVGLLC